MPAFLSSTIVSAAVIVIAGSIVGWWIVVARWLRGQPVPLYQRRRSVPWGLLDLALIVFATFATLVIAYAMVNSLLGIQTGTPRGDMDPKLVAILMLCDSTASLVAIAVACSFLAWRVGAALLDLGIDWQRIRADVGLGLVAFIILVVPVYLIQSLLTWLIPDQAEHPLITMLKTSAEPELLLVGVIVAVIVAPLAEEMFFRVILQGWLEKVADSRSSVHELIFGVPPGAATVPAFGSMSPSAGDSRAEGPIGDPSVESAVSPPNGLAGGQNYGADTAAREPVNPYVNPKLDTRATPASDSAATTPETPRRWPIIVSAAIFSAMHFGHGYDFVPLFFLALGLGYIYQQTHRVVPCIIIHLLLNAGSLLMLWLSVTYGEGM